MEARRLLANQTNVQILKIDIGNLIQNSQSIPRSKDNESSKTKSRDSKGSKDYVEGKSNLDDSRSRSKSHDHGDDSKSHSNSKDEMKDDCRRYSRSKEKIRGKSHSDDSKSHSRSRDDVKSKSRANDAKIYSSSKDEDKNKPSEDSRKHSRSKFDVKETSHCVDSKHLKSRDEIKYKGTDLDDSRRTLKISESLNSDDFTLIETADNSSRSTANLQGSGDQKNIALPASNSMLVTSRDITSNRDKVICDAGLTKAGYENNTAEIAVELDTQGKPATEIHVGNSISTDSSKFEKNTVDSQHIPMSKDKSAEAL